MRITEFSGMVPKTDRHNLNSNAASYASNCTFYSGGIDPLRKPAYVAQVCGPDGETPTEARTLIKSDGVWVGFEQQTFVAPDVLNRAGDESFLYVQDNKVRRSSGRWVKDGLGSGVLGISAPCAAPAYATVDDACTWDNPFPEGCMSELLPSVEDPSCGPNQNLPIEVAFLMTYVSGCEEESRPGPTTPHLSITRNQGVLLTDTNTPPDNAAYRRWYTWLVDSQGSGGWVLFAEEAIDVVAVVYCPAAYNHGGLLLSADWYEPPACVEGVAVVGNNVTLLWNQRDIWASEANQPHAYPPKFRLRVDFPIKEIVTLTSTPEGPVHYSAVILTTGGVYLLVGDLPENLDIRLISREAPHLNPGGTLTYAGVVLFASYDGIYAVQGGRVSNITYAFWTEDDWASVGAEHLRIGYWNNHLVVLNSRDTGKSFMMGWARQDNPYPMNLVYLDVTAGAVANRLDTPLHFTLPGTASLYAWAEAPERFTAVWRSATVVQVGRWHPTAGKIVTDGRRLSRKARDAAGKAWSIYKHLPLTVPEATEFARCHPTYAQDVTGYMHPAVSFSLISEDDTLFTRPVFSNWPFRLPRIRRSVDWSFEVRTSQRIVEVHIQTSQEDLTQGGGHA